LCCRQNFRKIRQSRSLTASSNGQLDAGVYLAEYSKAENFARDASSRGKGSGAVVLRSPSQVPLHSQEPGQFRALGQRERKLGVALRRCARALNKGVTQQRVVCQPVIDGDHRGLETRRRGQLEQFLI
jgi:hypothetical protein